MTGSPQAVDVVAVHVNVTDGGQPEVGFRGQQAELKMLIANGRVESSVESAVDTETRDG